MVEDQKIPILIHKLSEYMKVVEIAMEQVLGSMENKRTFNNLYFKKIKLHAYLANHT